MKWLAFFIVLASALFPKGAHSLFPKGDHSPFPKGDSSPFTPIARRPEALEPLPFGAVRPEGWLESQVRANLRGFTGHLDSLAPDLIIKDEIYGRDRLTKNVKKKDVGALAGGDSAADVQYLWWNSETQGNWRDGFIRSAILAGDAEMLARARAYVRRILATQDQDGYLGIYDRDLRYRFDGENGELWAKTTLLRGLLAWYAYTRDYTVLKAVERAVDNVMRHYPAGASHPFYSKTPDVGGLSHGLMFTDVLESLFRMTGREVYLNYALFLYKDFSEASLHEDAQYDKITDPFYKLKGHGVHTYEHLRAVAAAAYASGNPALLKALDEYLHKIAQEITPSGAPAGDEWIGGRPGDATTTGYEYCSLHELMDGYIDLMGKTGSALFGDQAEELFFNAAQGARDPDASCIAYLKTDNSYFMTGGLNGDSSNPHQTRYKYSPVHQDVAVCCAPNAGRIAPYFIDRMWMRNSSGLVATLLGPCKVSTTWKGTPVTIREKTVYPDEFSFDFQIIAEHAVNFTLAVRKPAWATRQSISYPYTERGGYYLITRSWQPGESVHLRLYADITIRRDRNNDVYFTNGPVVLARPISATAEITKRYPLAGFFDYHYRPDDSDIYTYKGGTIEHSGNSRFEVTLYNPAKERNAHVWLTPMGSTVLRQVTFSGIPVSESTQTIYGARLDSLFDILSAHNLAKGNICITAYGKIVYQRNVDMAQTRPATYRVGSITKVFTAVLIYELIEARSLTLDDTLSEFFPEIANAGKITIAEMLGHRSGLANFTATTTKFDTWKEQPQTHEQLLSFIRNQQPDFAPGAKADYNNSNFLLLGYILEKIYHKPYKDIVGERIIRKLGLLDTYYGDHAGFQGSEAVSYKYFDNQWQPEKAVYLDNFGGAGAMISTPQDLCTFITAIFSGKFISKASLARMTRIEKDGYGWGMFSFGDSLHTGYGHSGKTEGFASSMQYYPEGEFAISYCTNGELYPKDDILDDVFKICFAESCRIPTFTPVSLTLQQIQAFVGAYSGDNGLKVTCSVVNGGLVLEAKGQQFILEALSDHAFRNVRFGFFFEFDLNGKQLVVHDAAVTYWLHKE